MFFVGNAVTTTFAQPHSLKPELGPVEAQILLDGLR